MPRHRLDDAVWASLYVLLCSVENIWKRDEGGLRRFVEAVCYAVRTGIAWDDLPAEFGEAQSAQRRYRLWARKGLWDRLLQGTVPAAAASDTVTVDATICKAHRSAAGA